MNHQNEGTARDNNLRKDGMKHCDWGIAPPPNVLNPTVFLGSAQNLLGPVVLNLGLEYSKSFLSLHTVVYITIPQRNVFGCPCSWATQKGGVFFSLGDGTFIVGAIPQHRNGAYYFLSFKIICTFQLAYHLLFFCTCRLWHFGILFLIMLTFCNVFNVRSEWNKPCENLHEGFLISGGKVAQLTWSRIS